ncbi:Hsp70 family protein [Streptomyces sp. NPDC058548]|uniref:Hsp70 family protein n=1 Tax=Streptomyces sp. NPDC058548 TaxID=3346545 RepID=UPI00365E8EBE
MAVTRSVGIDLGTSRSVVCVLEDGKPVVVAGGQGLAATPSVVAFTEGGATLVGAAAEKHAVDHPDRVAVSALRRLGEPGRRWRFPQEGDIGGRTYTAQEIAARLLVELKRNAEAHLGGEVTGAVVAIPASFGQAQRQAVVEACQIAGLNLLRMVPATLATALATLSDRTGDETVAVLDVGAGACQASVLEAGEGMVEVKATRGDTGLGGDDFDTAVAQHLAEGFKKANGVDLASNAAAYRRLRDAARQARTELSTATDTSISLPGISGTLDLKDTLTRSQLETLTEHLVSKCSALLREAVQAAGPVDQVLLLGGVTAMPGIQDMARAATGKSPERVTADERVAAGAAIQAGVLTGEVKDIVVLDATAHSLSLGTQTSGGSATVLIPRDTTIPCRRSEVVSTAADDQGSVEVVLFQGERSLARENQVIARIHLTGIAPAPRGMPQIEVTIDIDTDGMVQASAKDRATGKPASMTIDSEALPKADLDRMTAEAR